jgi:hypothetical protein
MVTLIECPQGEQAGVTGDLATGEIGADGLMTAASRSSVLVKDFVSTDYAPKGAPWCARPGVHQPFRASFLFWQSLRE